MESAGEPEKHDDLVMLRSGSGNFRLLSSLQKATVHWFSVKRFNGWEFGKRHLLKEKEE